MNQHFTDPVATVEQAISKLQKEALSREAGAILSISINDVTKPKILQQQTEYPLLHWKSRDEDCQYYCWGISELFISLQEIDSDSLMPSFAIFAFDNQTTQWPGFPEKIIWRPRWCIQKKGEQILLFHLVSYSIPIPTTTGMYPTSQHHLPNEAKWIQQIEHIKKEFETDELSKIVLSRQSCVETGDIWKLFDELTTEQPNCYHFLFSPRKDEMFLGCSPERLFSISQNQLKTEAMAGTRPRGFAPQEDHQLNQELYNSNKDIVEHHFVTDYITQKLQDYSTDVTVLSRSIVQLKNVQHLHTPIVATLKDNFSVEQLLEALHPTPAVCGYPKELSCSKIRQLEPFSRGWYGGTFGIVRSDRIDFTVAIRSALAIRNQLFIWAGAGIVSESNASAEWLEITTKGKQFFDLAQR